LHNKIKKDNVMKKSIQSVFLAFVLLTILLSGCAPISTPVSPTFTPSLISPTFTPASPATAAPIPSPTSLPGSVVVPIDTLGKSYPWLPIDKSARPSTYFFYFNLSKPPFDNILVRQAFAASIDREALVEVAKKFGVKNPRPATTFTSPETLGRELYNEVGIPFNPAHAKDLLTQAGYADPSKFPPVTLLIGVSSSDVPGFHPKIAETMVNMWQQTLGVKVKVETLDSKTFFSRIASNPTEIFRATFFAGNNDPNDFLSIFHTGGKSNFGGFSNSEFDKLIELAAESNDPAERQELYIQAERILCETETALIPIYHATYP
jgi:ABC-type oligopeptide transport system substrate-binding subunit